MVQKVSQANYPSGISRLLYRSPIWLYDLHLDRILGNRFLKLTHTGRSSGLPRQVVLEVVKHEPQSGTYYVASAWGDRSDWVKNIRANPRVTVQVCGQQHEMLAEQLTPDQGEGIILDYAGKHPTTMVNLARYMGYQLDGSEADFRELGHLLLMFALKPLPQGSGA